MALLSGPDGLDAVVAVHIAAFPGFFMTQLGPRFLREYYRCVVEYPRGILLTEDSGGDCIAFVAGFVDPAPFYRELRSRRVRLGLAACAGLLTRPRRLFTLLANYRRAGGTAQQPSDARAAELSSLGVAPSAGGQGVGSRLVHAFIEAAGALGADRVMLATDAHGNDAVNGFYRRLGFACVRTFEARRGRVLNEYVLEIERG